MKKLLLLILCFFLVGCGGSKDNETEENIDTPIVTTPIDISGVIFDSITVTYDGNTHALICQNLPEGVIVEYQGNDVIEVGTHKVVAIIKDKDGKELGRKEAFIIIEEALVSLLDTPCLNIDEFGVVTWDEVSDATHYNYIINNGDILTTTLLTIALNNEETISVQAANSQLVSNWSIAVTNYDTSDIYEEAIEEVYVKFHNTSLNPIKVESGNVIDIPTAPEKEYYTFDNWYADPFYLEIFDFSQPIIKNTIIYANYIPSDLIKDTYFWVKGSPAMTASVMSDGSNSGWHFIPLKENTKNTNFKEFYSTVIVNGASAVNPCSFIVMDGFSDDSGRTYWKNGNSDFTITTDGVYNIYFSTEYEYALGIHAYIELAPNSASNLAYEYQALELDVPNVRVDKVNDKALWPKVNGAIMYEVVIDNNAPVTTKQTKIELPEGSHITVRAIGDGKVSRWSLPKANRRVVVIDEVDEWCMVYFTGYESYQVKTMEEIIAPNNPEKKGFVFEGWYLDYACTTLATFPYEVVENTVFYPKWTAVDDWKTKIYYNLIDENGTIIKGLTWNLDNYTFDEYETGAVRLEANTNYYIVLVNDDTAKYGPYTVKTTGTYKLYFSEDNLWDGQHVYIASNTITLYFSNSKRWSDTIYAYVWNSATGKTEHYWPGEELTFVETNGYGEDIYKIEVDLSLYDMIIFSHGTDGVIATQTVDISLLEYTNNGFYVTEKVNGKYQIGTYSR